MRIVSQLFWVIFFSLLGEVLSIVIQPFVAIPASVIGMVLLFLALHYKIIKLEQVEDVGNFLTSNMAFLFVPSGVGLMTNLDLFADLWWQYLIIVFVSVVVLIGLVGRLIQTLNARNQQLSKKYESATPETEGRRGEK